MKHKFVHTTTDILVPNLQTQGKSKLVPCTGFYSHCAPTHLRENGVLSLTENSPNQPAYWWHGRPSGSHMGGEAWEMPAIAHALPVLGPSLKMRGKTLGPLRANGFDEEYGHVKLVPIQ